MDNGKKNAHKFTLQLNYADPQHRKAIDILNKHGRRKGQFIVNAVLHYANYPEPSKNGAVDFSVIEDFVTKIIFKHINPGTDKNNVKKKNPRTKNETGKLKTENPVKPIEEDNDMLKDIKNSLDIFRRKSDN